MKEIHTEDSMPVYSFTILHFVILVVYLVPHLNVAAQFPASIDSVYTFIRSNSIFRDQVNWASADRQFHQCIIQAGSQGDTLSYIAG